MSADSGDLLDVDDWKSGVITDTGRSGHDFSDVEVFLIAFSKSLPAPAAESRCLASADKERAGTEGVVVLVAVGGGVNSAE